ncbi:MAG: SAM-dependent methyltransferase [Blastocatellia bacterium]
MFDLSEQDLNSSILGCGDGPASFNSEMNELGRKVTSVDPIYSFSRQQIEHRIQETYETIISQCKERPGSFVWSYFSDPDALGKHRLAAMRVFLNDFELGLAAGRYMAGELPRLSFASRSFDLALCSHLLFLYTKQLSQEFHLKAVEEMCRVAREVRIFPLLDLDCKTSAHMDPVVAKLSRSGHNVEITRVPYEFQRGGDKMMRVSKQDAAISKTSKDSNQTPDH